MKRNARAWSIHSQYAASTQAPVERSATHQKSKENSHSGETSSYDQSLEAASINRARSKT